MTRRRPSSKANCPSMLIMRKPWPILATSRLRKMIQIRPSRCSGRLCNRARIFASRISTWELSSPSKAIMKRQSPSLSAPWNWILNSPMRTTGLDASIKPPASEPQPKRSSPKSANSTKKPRKTSPAKCPPPRRPCHSSASRTEPFMLVDSYARVCDTMKKLSALFTVICFLCLGSLGSQASRAQSKRGVTPEDYFSFKFMGDPHISPDGKVVAYVVTGIDQKKNRRESSIWIVPIDGSAAPRRLSAEGFSSNSPRWSPDGKMLAFLSARSSDLAAGEAPKSQIYLLSIAGGGEAIALTKLKNGVQS